MHSDLPQLLFFAIIRNPADSSGADRVFSFLSDVISSTGPLKRPMFAWLPESSLLPGASAREGDEALTSRPEPASVPERSLPWVPPEQAHRRA